MVADRPMRTDLTMDGDRAVSVQVDVTDYATQAWEVELPDPGQRDNFDPAGRDRACAEQAALVLEDIARQIRTAFP